MAAAALRFVPCFGVQRCEMRHSKSETGGPPSGCRCTQGCPAEAPTSPHAHAAWVHGTALLLLLLLPGRAALLWVTVQDTELHMSAMVQEPLHGQ